MKLSSRIAGIALLGMLVAGVVQAAPITYTFTASDFYSLFGNAPAPYSIIAGDVTIDGTTVVGIDLTIGCYSYSTADVQFLPWPAGAGILGGIGPNSNVADAVFSNTNDFQLSGDFGSMSWWSFSYSVPGVSDVFNPNRLTVTIPELPKPVPLPGALGMLITGLGVLGAITRRRNQAA